MKNPRGWIWIAIGVVAFVVGRIAPAYELYVRGTRVPYALIALGVGVLIVGYDWRRGRNPGAPGAPKK